VSQRYVEHLTCKRRAIAFRNRLGDHPRRRTARASACRCQGRGDHPLECGWWEPADYPQRFAAASAYKPSHKWKLRCIYREDAAAIDLTDAQSMMLEPFVDEMPR